MRSGEAGSTPEVDFEVTPSSIPVPRFEHVSDRVGLEGPINDWECGVAAGSAWADIDGDADLDVYVANDSNPNFLYRNLGDGSGATLTETEALAAPAAVPTACATPTTTGTTSEASGTVRFQASLLSMKASPSLLRIADSESQ